MVTLQQQLILGIRGEFAPRCQDIWVERRSRHPSVWSRARVKTVALDFATHQVFSTQERRQRRVPGEGGDCAQRAGCLGVGMNHLKRSKQNKTKPKSKSRWVGLGTGAGRDSYPSAGLEEVGAISWESEVGISYKK